MNFYAWLKRSFRNFHELDYELFVKLQDHWWKVNNHECSLFSNWRNHIQGPYTNYYSNFLDKEEHDDKDKHGLFDDQKRPVCNIRRFKMIKYSVSEDEEYVAIKEHEYDDLTSTNEDACRTYQEIFHRMYEGWMDLAGKEIEKVGEVSIIWNPVCVVVMLEFRRIYNTHSCS
ncbi:hypothetical protein Tco_1424883 [Tanacetum coccineum]